LLACSHVLLSVSFSSFHPFSSVSFLAAMRLFFYKK
jgi:hypothetical protein